MIKKIKEKLFNRRVDLYKPSGIPNNYFSRTALFLCNIKNDFYIDACEEIIKDKNRNIESLNRKLKVTNDNHDKTVSSLMRAIDKLTEQKKVAA